MSEPRPLVGVIMGSRSDWETMRHACETLDELGVPYERRVVSAHRTPDLVFEYAAGARDRGLEAIIAGAGGAAHLPGMTAAKTTLPVLGVPVESRALSGLDSLLSIVQMPAGIAVGTLAIGRAGAINAALLAAAIVAGSRPELLAALERRRTEQTRSVLDAPDPGSLMRLGMLGGGQLARMLALAAHPLDVRCTALDPALDACAGSVAELIVAAYDDTGALDRLADRSDVVTFEFENVPAAAVERLAAAVTVAPAARSLEVSQDRLSEKRLFQKLGIETPDFWPVTSQADADSLAELPVVLKTCRLGYDGKGQRIVRDRAGMDGVFERLGGVPLVAEALVPFERELSIVAVRSADGCSACYPLVENHHREGILRVTRFPAPGHDDLQSLAERHVRAIMDDLDHVGVLALELFQVGTLLLANEIAPRVHNSGHWTIEGAVTSQFENHVRAVLDLPLGPAAPRGEGAMVNLIGLVPDTRRVLEVPGAHLHLYGKSPRPGRKLGHVTIAGGVDVDDVLPLLQGLADR